MKTKESPATEMLSDPTFDQLCREARTHNVSASIVDRCQGLTSFLLRVNHATDARRSSSLKVMATIRSFSGGAPA